MQWRVPNAKTLDNLSFCCEKQNGLRPNEKKDLCQARQGATPIQGLPDAALLDGFRLDAKPQPRHRLLPEAAHDARLGVLV